MPIHLIRHGYESSEGVLTLLLNAWLSYALAQPVSFDLRMLWRFAMDYTGFPVWWRLLKQLHQFLRWSEMEEDNTSPALS